MKERWQEKMSRKKEERKVKQNETLICGIRFAILFSLLLSLDRENDSHTQAGNSFENETESKRGGRRYGDDDDDDDYTIPYGMCVPYFFFINSLLSFFSAFVCISNCLLNRSMAFLLSSGSYHPVSLSVYGVSVCEKSEAPE